MIAITIISSTRVKPRFVSFIYRKERNYLYKIYPEPLPLRTTPRVSRVVLSVPLNEPERILIAHEKFPPYSFSNCAPSANWIFPPAESPEPYT